MNSFYGNIISHLPRSGFNFTKIFSNRAELDAYDWENKGTELGVGAYVIINYNQGSEADNAKNYQNNLNIDTATYSEINLSGADYHSTVWQVRKDEIKNVIVCSFQLIAKINSTLISNFIPIGSYFTMENMDFWDYATYGAAEIAWPNSNNPDGWMTTVIDLSELIVEEPKKDEVNSDSSNS